MGSDAGMGRAWGAGMGGPGLHLVRASLRMTVPNGQTDRDCAVCLSLCHFVPLLPRGVVVRACVQVKERVRKGIPPGLRGLAWQMLCGSRRMYDENRGVFAVCTATLLPLDPVPRTG